MLLTSAIRVAFLGLGLTSAVPLSGKRQTSTTYDYVVVGSGAGGGPLAARLAIAGFKVLLIDAGDDEGTSYQEEVPALQLLSTEYQPMAWDFYVNHYRNETRQETDTKMTWKTPSGSLYVGIAPPAGSTPLGILYPRSGTLGGCSAHNALITIYPHDSDWANIQTITGDSSWSPSNMRTYFEKLEQNHYVAQPLFGLNNGHGYNGWLGTATTSLTLAIQDSKTISLLTAAASAMGKSLLGIFLNTILGIGEVFALDPNAPGQSSVPGLYQVPISMLNGVRSSTRDFVLATANAVNANGSPKYQLDLLLKTLVTKVIFDQTVSPPKAIGVQYLNGQSLYRADPRSDSASPTGSGSVNVTKEVILSAGSFNTPQLLKLSGIGPQAELESFNIPVIVNLPGVGTNLQDRYEASVTATASSDFVTTEKCTFLRTSPDPCLQQWISGTDQTSKGTYASNGLAIGAIQKSSVATGDPDLFIAGGPTNFVGYYPGYSAVANNDSLHWTWLVLKAHSRNNAGTVQLRSADPRDTPIINFNSFDTGVTTGGADQLDLEALYEGFEYARTIFQDVIGGGFTEQYPGPSISTEAQAKSFLAQEAWGHHASCTCPIGAASDPMAVLDSKFRVRGVQSLRVVDASVFPKIPGFYIALPIYMISEKAADVIINNL